MTDAALRWLHRRFGTEACRLWVGPSRLVVSVARYDSVAEALESAPDRPTDGDARVLYRGATALQYLPWSEETKEARAQFSKLLGSPDALRAVHAVTVSTAMRETRNWWRAPVDVYAELAPLAYDVVGECVFRKRWAALSARVRPAHEHVVRNAARFNVFRGPLVAGYADFADAARRLRAGFAQALEQHHAAARADPAALEGDASLLTGVVALARDGSGRFDVDAGVALLMSAWDGAVTTTHAALAWALYHLAKFQHVQEKLLRELDGAVGRALPPTIEDVRKLPLLHAFIQESMRAAPPMPVIARVSRGADLTVEGRHVPRGATIVAATSVTCADPDAFPQPTYFRPERFLGESVEAVNARARWIAFGAGPRACPGAAFALTEMKAALAIVMQRYAVRVSHNGPLDGVETRVLAGVAVPAEPLELVFTRRESERAL